MIDISMLNDEQISELAGLFVYLQFFHDGDPTTATERQKRKLRKSTNSHINELPEELQSHDILELAKECYTIQKAAQKAKREQFEDDFAAFGEDVRSALDYLHSLEFWVNVWQDGNNVKIVVNETSAYRRILTLVNADDLPDKVDGFNCNNFELKKNGDRFYFCGELADPVYDNIEKFSLGFDTATVEIVSYNACKQSIWASQWTPWGFLQDICYDICLKADLPGDHCNEKEKELLPLIRAISILEHYIDREDDMTLPFAEFKKIIEQFGFTELLKLPDKLERKMEHRRFRQLSSLLCRKKYEPLWREIYNKIADSQSEYPGKAEALCDKQLLNDTRERIQALMEKNGYIGTYPEFVKDGVLKGMHLERSYDSTYIVGMEKRAQFHVLCQEELTECDGLEIHFICGTALLKDGEDDTDVFSCLFKADGRRFFSIMNHYVPYQEEYKSAHGTTEDDLEIAVTIAVKKAECEKLNKPEKMLFYGTNAPGMKLFWMFMIIAGGLFGVAMTASMMIICAIVTALFGLWREIPGMLHSVPWGWILLLSWVGFGGTMGAIELLSRRK